MSDVALVRNCAAAGGRGGTVHRAEEADPRIVEDLTPVCPIGKLGRQQRSIRYDATDRVVNCPSCVEQLAR